MARITLIRHGEAAAGFGEHTDPGLSELGRQQADAVADALAAQSQVPILSSPLRRCQETAAPLASRWSAPVAVEPRVGEIQSPTDDLVERSEWLRGVMQSRWSELDDRLRAWADDLVACLLELPEDTIVYSHFVAINAAIGRATGDERVISVRLGNCSRTVLDNAGGALTLVEQPIPVDHTDVL